MSRAIQLLKTKRMLSRLGQILFWATLTGTLLAFTSGADALCFYGGKHFTKAKDGDHFDRRLYATTTLADEFQDSVLVVKGTVLSSRSIGLDPPNESGWGTIYRVRVDHIFKGKAPAIILDYTDRDSGGFYLGEGGEGREYLLFLNPGRTDWVRKLVKRTYEVNYNCGQSRPWGKVSSKDRDELMSLSKSDY